jgi:hypothetical protein
MRGLHAVHVAPFLPHAMALRLSVRHRLPEQQPPSQLPHRQMPSRHTLVSGQSGAPSQVQMPPTQRLPRWPQLNPLQTTSPPSHGKSQTPFLHFEPSGQATQAFACAPQAV